MMNDIKKLIQVIISTARKQVSFKGQLLVQLVGFVSARGSVRCGAETDTVQKK